MSNDITPFEFKGKKVRWIFINGEPWWVLKDLCDILKLVNPSDVATRITKEYLAQAEVLDARGIPRSTNVVSEPGLWQVILRSDSSEAEPVQRWVYEEVLPQIRNTGKFESEPQPNLTPAEYLLMQAQRFVEIERTTRELAAQQGYQQNWLTDLDARVSGIEQRTDWLVALAYAKLKRLPDTSNTFLNKLGRRAAKITRSEGLEPQKVYSEMFGEVNSYPTWALDKALEELQNYGKSG